MLYNLNNININERKRELATIKVLGFYDNEVTMYIYRETISLSLIGIVVGLISGKYLHQLIMNMIGSDSIKFGTEVSLSNLHHSNYRCYWHTILVRLAC